MYKYCVSVTVELVLRMWFRIQKNAKIAIVLLSVARNPPNPRVSTRADWAGRGTLGRA